MINIWKAEKKSIFFKELCDDIRDAIWIIYQDCGQSSSMAADLLGVPKSTFIDTLKKFSEYDERFKEIKKPPKGLMGASWKEFYKHKAMGKRIERLERSYLKKVKLIKIDGESYQGGICDLQKSSPKKPK